MTTATAEQTKTPTPEQAGAPQGRSLASLTAGTAKVMPIIPSNMDQVWRLAKAIAFAGWAPKHYKTKEGTFEEEKIAVAIMHGMEVGFTPIAALQSIAVINGMPSIYGDGALALVLASGLMEDYRETRILDQQGKVIGFTFWAKRKGKATPIEQKFDREDASRAGLLGKDGPWKQYEPRMYQMRARGWGLRDGFADVLKGLSIAEEVMDIIDVTPANRQPATDQQRGAAGLKQALVQKDAAPQVSPPGDASAQAATPPRPATAAVELTVIDHIAKLAGLNSLEAIANYADSMPEEMLQDPRWTEASQKRLAEINGQAT